MTKRTAALTSIFVLALGIFAGSALAGNGNGNGKADPAVSAEPVSHEGGAGSSDKTPPGQAKKDQAAAAAPQASGGGGSADQNSVGVNGNKPTNSTSKGTHCSTGGGNGSSATCAPTSPNAAAATGNGDVSKRYGNGVTAAQIANSNGAPAGTDVYGPGNSQPHKVACPGSTKYRDVHAVKHYESCAAQSPSITNTTVQVTTTAGVPNKAATAAVAAGVQGSVATPTGGVLGQSAAGGNAVPAGGVLGAIEAVGQGTLPFTGLPLWTVALIALGLVAMGLTLRRHARAAV